MTSGKQFVVVWVAIAMLCAAVSGCSREQRDWRSAQSADSLEAYDQFLERHPDGQLATQARTRLLQLTEERDWQRASTSDTADAYKRFLNQHPNGKWSQEAHIRSENFALEGQPINAPTAMASPSQRASSSPTSAAPMSAAPMSASSSANAQPHADDTARAAAAPMSEHAAASVSEAPRVTAMDSPAHAVSTPSPSAASADSDFGIQLGAFSTESKANSEWQRLQSQFAAELGSLRPHIVSATTSAGLLFRLQSQVETESRARAICASLTQKSQGCVVVLPHH